MIKAISITNFRGFAGSNITLDKELTILVGKNNAGKSTLIEALRIVSLVIIRLQNPKFVDPPMWLDSNMDKGITPSLQSLSISNKNIFYLYNADNHAIIEVQFSNNVKIKIFINNDLQVFAQIQSSNNRHITNAKMLKIESIPTINILPQISPLLEEEKIIKDKTLVANLFTRLTSRHFRNQIYKFNGSFTTFKELSEKTWFGLQITEPNYNDRVTADNLSLMVRDGVFTAEVAQMGHGLQMWLQTMWFLSRCDKDSVVILDEPDVYMHADMQRKLIRLLKGKFKQVIVATHSVEIISDVEADNILPIDKSASKQKYATSSKIVQQTINNIGSIHNLDLARLSSANKVIFTEGPKEDIDILGIFHSKLYPQSVYPLCNIPHVNTKGWSGWQRVCGAVDVFLQKR
ncbi:MAG: ATP-binding protein [Rikenellaceae bacterium]